MGLVRLGTALLAGCLTAVCSLGAAFPSTLEAASSLIGSVASADGAAYLGCDDHASRQRHDANGDQRSRGCFQHRCSLGRGILSVCHCQGFAPLANRTIDIPQGTRSTITLVMSVGQASSLTVLGRVTVNGGQALSTASAPSVEIDAPAYAAKGVTRVSDTLLDSPSTTVIPMVGGGFNAPAVVALRGPDPSETLVAVDGHQVNNGNTGDYDLSLLDPADLQNVQIVYGIAPSSLVGPDTLGGAINIRTLEPTTTPQSLLRLTASSYDTFGETLQTTGTDERLGYALSYHRVTSGGELDNYAVIDDDGNQSVVGDGLDATSTLAKLRYSFDGGAGFVGVTFRDQAAYRDLSATLSSIDGYDADGNPLYDSFAGSAVLSHNAGYGLDVQVPLGLSNGTGVPSTTMLFRHLTSLESQSVEGPAIGTSPYLLSGRDVINDDTLELVHPLADGSFSLKFALTTETLATDYSPDAVDNNGLAHRGAPSASQSIAPLDSQTGDSGDSPPAGSQVALGQTERSVGLRYAIDPTPKLHYTLAAYYSDYSAFGRSLDPRFGFVWTPTANAAFRFSLGSTFQSPQLPSLLIPSPLPPPVGGYVSVGNPNLTAERATEYDIGYEHLFGDSRHQIHLGADAYRTDLHNGIATFFPATTCATVPAESCLSYPINVDREVYAGIELEGDARVTRSIALHATYGVDSVYTESFPPSTQDGTIVAYEQALGVPLHKASLRIDGMPDQKVDWYAGVLYEGWYNELNRGPFATLQAGITGHLRGNFDVGVYGTNLTNVYNTKVTVQNGGVPYGAVDGPIPTDAYALAGPTITFSVTKRM